MPQLPSRLTAPPQALVELASLIRRRLQTTVTATVRGTLRAGVGALVPRGRDAARPVEPARPDAVIVAAAEQFAPNAYARARLLRQMHACGLLDERETEQAGHLLGVAN